MTIFLDTTNGLDSNDGSEGAPKKTLVAALAVCQANENVVIKKSNGKFYPHRTKKLNRNIVHKYRNEAGKGFFYIGNSDDDLIDTYKLVHDGRIPDEGIDAYLDGLPQQIGED